MVEVAAQEVTIGRDPSNTVVLASPLVSRHHAVVRLRGGQLHLENVGLNSCVVGDVEVSARRRPSSTPAPRCGSGPLR